MKTKRKEGKETKNKSLTIFIPALNEEKHIGNVIDELPLKEIKKMGFKAEVLVVNGPSADRTEEIAKKKGARVIRTKRGKGNAVRDAFNFIQSDYTIMLDADETYPGEYIIPILKELEKGNDVVLGSRLGGKIEEGAMSQFNKAGNRVLTTFANLLFGTKISDLCTGYWGLTKKAIKGIRVSAEGFDVEANIFSEFSKKGYKFSEININYRKRGDEPKLRAISDGMKIGKRLFDLKFLANKKIIQNNLAAIFCLLIANGLFYHFFFNIFPSMHSFRFFGYEIAPLMVTSLLLLFTYGLMIYLTRGKISSTIFSCIVLMLSTNFVYSFALLPWRMLIGFLLFTVCLFGILVTFGKENFPRYVFILVPYAIIFFIDKSLFFVLLIVFVLYLLTEYKSIASKRLVWFWIAASLALFALTANIFSAQKTKINPFYYFGVAHFAIAMLGFYHCAFQKRGRMLVLLSLLLVALIYASLSFSSVFIISPATLITLFVYVVILLTGVGIERIWFYGQKMLGIERK